MAVPAALVEVAGQTVQLVQELEEPAVPSNVSSAFEVAEIEPVEAAEGVLIQSPTAAGSGLAFVDRMEEHVAVLAVTVARPGAVGLADVVVGLPTSVAVAAEKVVAVVSQVQLEQM